MAFTKAIRAMLQAALTSVLVMINSLSFSSNVSRVNSNEVRKEMSNNLKFEKASV
jgi:hypothetical protein